MKRTLGLMASNWLRKPENQQKIKRTARSLWDRLQQRRSAAREASKTTAAASRRDTSTTDSHGRRE